MVTKTCLALFQSCEICGGPIRAFWQNFAHQFTQPQIGDLSKFVSWLGASSELLPDLLLQTWKAGEHSFLALSRHIGLLSHIITSNVTFSRAWPIHRAIPRESMGQVMKEG